MRRILSGRFIWPLIVIIVLFTVIWLFRFPILRATGDLLINNDPAVRTHALYVLGGAPADRGRAAAEWLDRDLAPKAYCLGKNIPQVMEAAGMMYNEGMLTADMMVRSGADPDRVHVLAEGTSTWEESHAILEHALQLGFDSITVLTTDLHSRRVGRVFRAPFRKNGITVLVHGAPSSQYDPQRWWENEEGLLMVNNEYVKLMYYWLKY